MTRTLVWLGAAVAAGVFAVSGHPVWAGVVVGVAAGGLCRFGRGPRLFPQWMRERLLARDGGRCVYCGVPVHYAAGCPFAGCDDCFEADHVQAWANGGRTTLANGVVACRACNRAKSDN